MRKLSLLVLCILLAITVATAQDTSSSGAAQSNSVIRGCLSGSAGNFTLTDQNGMLYKLVGEDTALQPKVGHEVEVSGTAGHSGEVSSEANDSMAHTSNSFQVSGVRDVSGSCRLGREGSNQPLSDSTQPDRAAQTAQPKLIAMLQQPASQEPMQKGNDAQQPQTTSPPVTSQTPAASEPPTKEQPQNGTTSTPSDAMTPSQTQAGQAPNTQNSVGSQPDSTATPQANDQNKPLYERPATDVPWAQHSGSTTTPNNPQ